MDIICTLRCDHQIELVSSVSSYQQNLVSQIANVSNMLVVMCYDHFVTDKQDYRLRGTLNEFYR